MKKIFRVLLISLLVLVNTIGVKAIDKQYLFVDENVMSTFEEGDYDYLNWMMQDVANNYDLGIYYILDETIEDDNLISYAQNFLKNNAENKNNVVLCLNQTHYYVFAIGDDTSCITDDAEACFKAYQSGYYFYSGIIAYAEYVTGKVNELTYTTSVDLVKDNPKVYDAYGVLSAGEVKTLSDNLKKVSDNTGLDVVVCVVDSLKGMNSQDYADDFYDYNGYGNDGVMLLLAMEEREWYVTSKGKGETYFNSYNIDSLMSPVLVYLSNDNYSLAFNEFASQIDYYVKAYDDSNNYSNQPVKKTFGSGNLAVSFIVALIVTLIVVLILKGQLKSVSYERYAHNYIVSNSFRINGYSDHFLGSTLSKSARYHPSDNDRSSGGSSSSSHSHTSHISSSGSSHSGHGGKF